MSEYPIGSTWVAQGDRGDKLTIRLDSRDGTFEVWRWSFCHLDGSSPSDFGGGDWGTSYRACYDQCAHKLAVNGKVPRFKRVKQETSNE